MRPTGELLERGKELEALAVTMRDAAAGTGGVVTIRGPAGIGKTGLMLAAGALAADAGLPVLRARGSELSRDVPFAVVREVLEGVLRGRADGGASLLKGGAAAAAAVLDASVQPATPADPGSTLLGLYWLLANLCGEQPLVLSVDDAHWSDDRSVDLLEFLGARAGELPAVLVVAARPPAGPAEADPLARIEAHAEHVRRLEPRPLSARAVAQLVRRRTGRRVAAAFATACAQATGGNPFYVSELAEELVAEGLAPSAAQADRVRELGPRGVARTTLVRINRIGDDGVSVARSLAVLGDDAEARHLAAHAGLDGERLASALAALTREVLVADERQPRFAHPIVRAAILAELPAADRGQLHARAALVLHEHGAAAERVAVHLIEAEPGAAGPWAVDELRSAAAEARNRGAPGAAARLLRRALAEPDGSADRGLVRELGIAAFEAGEPDALEHLRAVHAAGTDPRARALAALDLALPLTSTGAVGDAVALLVEALEEIDAVDPALSGELEAQLSAVALLEPAAHAPIMRRLEARALSATRTAGDRRLWGNVAQWVAMRGGSAGEVAELAQRALDGGALLVGSGPNAPSFLYAVSLLILADHFAEADAELDSALESARRSGSVSGFVTASMLRSLSAYRQGAIEAAVAEARAASDTARLHGWGSGLPATVGFLVDALIERGDLDEAQLVLADSGIGEAVPGEVLGQAYLVARARLRLARGELPEAIADRERLGELVAGKGWSTTIGTPTYRTYLAPALLAVGEPARAQALADEEVALARAWGAPRAIGTALRVRALAAEGPQRIELLREATATLAPSAARLEHARALADLGAALRRAGQPSAARQPLTEAIDLAHRCGARPVVEHAQEELAASGYRRRRRLLLRGVEALTPSERRIVYMAAEGQSNVEIAQALFLSRKTIEMHLGNAYAKLGVRSREELGAVLDG